MRTRRRALVYYFRIAAGVLLFALFAVFLPFDWMDAIHRWLGLGDLPRGPIIDYLTRSLSLLYALFGCLCLAISLDVDRYLPLVRFMAVASVAFGVIIIGIDLVAGMPLSWIVGEGTSILVSSGLLLWLAFREPGSLKRRESEPEA